MELRPQQQSSCQATELKHCCSRAPAPATELRPRARGLLPSNKAHPPTTELQPLHNGAPFPLQKGSCPGKELFAAEMEVLQSSSPRNRAPTPAATELLSWERSSNPATKLLPLQRSSLAPTLALVPAAELGTSNEAPALAKKLRCQHKRSTGGGSKAPAPQQRSSCRGLLWL